MAERRSPGAESLAVFDQTLDRLLAGSGYDTDVQAQVLESVRGGASTIVKIAERTGLAPATVEQAVRVLAAQGMIVRKKPSRPGRRATSTQPSTGPVANTG